MTKDVAVVHWTEGAQEKSARAYTIQMLSQLIETMEKKGVMYIVCLTRLDTNIPTQPSKPFKGHIAPLEYVGRMEVAKPLHGAFKEVTPFEPYHHPVTMEKVKKAYGV